MPQDKDFEHNETKAEEQLQIVDPPVPGQDEDAESGQQQAGHADGSPTGGAEDPGAERQNPTSEPDQDNEPLPRAWN